LPERTIDKLAAIVAVATVDGLPLIHCPDLYKIGDQRF
jgi:hypothetical protein